MTRQTAFRKAAEFAATLPEGDTNRKAIEELIDYAHSDRRMRHGQEHKVIKLEAQIAELSREWRPYEEIAEAYTSKLLVVRWAEKCEKSGYRYIYSVGQHDGKAWVFDREIPERDKQWLNIPKSSCGCQRLSTIIQ